MTFTRRHLLAAMAAATVARPAPAANLLKLADREWTKVESRHLAILTESREAEAKRLVAEVEALRWFLVDVLRMGLQMPTRQLPIVAIGSKFAWLQLGLPDNFVGSIGANGGISKLTDYKPNDLQNGVAKSAVLSAVVHAMFASTSGTTHYPFWYLEGMRSYLSSFNLQGDTIRLGDLADMQNRAQQLANAGRIEIDVKQLFTTKTVPYASELTTDRVVVMRFLSGAYFAAHYFNSTNELRAQVAEYLSLLASGRSDEEAVRGAFKRSYAELGRDIPEYVHQRYLTRVYHLPTLGLTVPQPQISSRRLTQAEIIADLSFILPHIKLIDRSAIDILLAKNAQLHPAQP